MSSWSGGKRSSRSRSAPIPARRHTATLQFPPAAADNDEVLLPLSRSHAAAAMPISIEKKSTPSIALLISILLTGLAMLGHRILPERRLTLESTGKDPYPFLMQSGDGAPADIQWIDQSNFHFACQFPKATVEQGCSFGFP